MFKKVMVLAVLAGLFACSKESANVDKDPDSTSSVRKDANGDEIVPVPFFELAKGDTVSKSVYRLKSKRVDTTTTVLYSTEFQSPSLKSLGTSAGISGAYIHRKMYTYTRVYKNNVPDVIDVTNRYYYRIPVDLNEYAGGYYIWLFIGKTDDINESLCGIKTVSPPNRIRSVGFPQHELGYNRGSINDYYTDLNDGVGGDYIYLTGYYYSDFINIHAAYSDYWFQDDQRPIREIMIVGTGEDEPTFNSKMTSRYPGWRMVYKDLNDGAGGSYVYLCYKK